MIIQGKPEQLAEKAAWLICREGIAKLLKTQSHVVVALPGGRSVGVILDKLAGFDLDWQRVHVFMLDERLVPIDHPESNYRLIQSHLGSRAITANLHPFHYDQNNPAGSLKGYEDQLRSLGGRFDIVLASSGEDGHIGSLFPHHQSVESRSDGYLYLSDAPKPPPGRLSAGAGLIRKAAVGLVLFIGKAKKGALDTFLAGDCRIQDCPAKIMQALPLCYVLTDQEVRLP